MAHAEIQATFDRHLPYWEAHGCPLLIVCPTNSIVRTKWPVLALERSTHHGPEINRKFRRMLQFAETMDYSYYMFFEYDALCLSQKLDLGFCGMLTGNRFENHEQPRFKETHFLHPPLAISKDILERINSSWKLLPDDGQEGFWDRQIGYLCNLAKIPTADWNGNGYAQNTIEARHIPEAVAARRNGAVMFHGIKTDEVLQAIVNGRVQTARKEEA